jgi:hypothetical protein
MPRNDLPKLKGGFNLDNPLNPACWLLCCLSFYSIACLGELTIPNENLFNKHRARDKCYPPIAGIKRKTN